MKQVKTLQELADTAFAKRAVICPKSYCCSKPIPAGFILNMQGAEILKLLRWGLYVYEPKKKTGKWGSIVHIPITRKKVEQAQKDMNKAMRKFEDNMPTYTLYGSNDGVNWKKFLIQK